MNQNSKVKSGKVKIEQLSSGVAGLDEILGGGVPEFSFNIIAGAPGCGKTTMAHQFVLHDLQLANYGVSLSQKEIFRPQASFYRDPRSRRDDGWRHS